MDVHPAIKPSSSNTKIVNCKIIKIEPSITPGICKASSPGKSSNFNPPTFFLIQIEKEKVGIRWSYIEKDNYLLNWSHWQSTAINHLIQTSLYGKEIDIWARLGDWYLCWDFPMKTLYLITSQEVLISKNDTHIKLLWNWLLIKGNTCWACIEKVRKHTPPVPVNLQPYRNALSKCV